MQRDLQTPAEGLIDLGQSSVETRGPGGNSPEIVGARLTDDISDD